MRTLALGLVALLAVAVPGAADAQAQVLDILSGRALDASNLTTAADPTQSLVSIEAEIVPAALGRGPALAITATITPPWYTYSTTQKPVGATPTQITVDPSNDFKLSGDFQPNVKPQIHEELGMTQETFAPTVTWKAPLEVRQGVNLKDVKITGKVKLAVCQTGKCLPPSEFPFTAQMRSSGGGDLMSQPVFTFSSPSGHVTFKGQFASAVVTPGSTVDLTIAASLAEGWHLYELRDQDPQNLGYKPTLIAFTTPGLVTEGTKADREPKFVKAQAAGLPDQRYYLNRVTFTTPIKVPHDAAPGPHTIEGVIGYQTCDEHTCDPPNGVRFQVAVNVGNEASRTPSAVAFEPAQYKDAAAQAIASSNPAAPGGTPEVIVSGVSYSSLPMVILFSLVGGFILNFMPCVLPVIGLKILSFAEQAGRSRSHILALNIWYTLGALAVFWVLATLATVLNLSWGQQFQSTTLNVVLVGVVFTMALSFLGVWEIPIPGFLGSSQASNLAAREGATGAFVKGSLTTILATPCSGPALGSVFGYTLGQPPHVTYLIFTCIGLGMCLPYLVIGVFPQLIRYLPKPGAWMETFKQLMGFVLLGTIVFLFSFMDEEYLVATFAMMVAIWAACWWIGRTPLYESLSKKLKAWTQGAIIAALGTWFAFAWLTPHESLIPWQPFSLAELERQRDAGNTVLIEFTADWCGSCKFNLYTAIETEDVRQAIERNRIVPLLADFTDTEGSPEIKQMLNSLNFNSIPLLAIFPADTSKPAIVIPDLLTKKDVLGAIEKAGPSVGVAKTARAALP